MLARLWYARWKHTHWLKHLFGRMSEPSMAVRGATEFIASLPRIHVSLSHAPANEKGNQTQGTSGPTSPALSESVSLPWCSSKMYAAICASDSNASAEIFRRWATTLGRDYSALKRWAHRTDAYDCSRWPTSVMPSGGRVTRFAQGGEPLEMAAEQWRTPDAPGAGGPRNQQESQGQGHQVTIAEQAEHWGTPNAHDATGARGPGFEMTDGHTKPHDLAKHAEQWTTPGTDSFRSRGGDRVNEMGLDQEARHWQSPQGRDFRSGEITQETKEKHVGSRPLNEEVLNWPSPRTEDSESCGNHPNATDSLRGSVQNWLTPHGAMGHEADGTYGCCGEAAKEAANWRTPTACSENSLRGSGQNAARRAEQGHAINLQDEVNAWNVPTTSRPTEPETSTAGPMCWCGLPSCVQRSHKRKLNVYFDEWLQGWPTNWSSAEKELTGFDQWERESRQLLWHLLSSYWQRSTGSESQPSLF